MAAVTTVIAAAALVVGVVGGIQQYRQGRQAQKAADRAAEDQKAIQGEQRANQAREAAAERRRMARERRIRVAQVQQSAMNTGTDGSSGSLGAQSSIASNYGSNTGNHLGALSSADRMGRYAQSAENHMASARSHQNKSSMWGNISDFGFNTFNTAGGFGTLQDAMSSGQSNTNSWGNPKSWDSYLR